MGLKIMTLGYPVDTGGKAPLKPFDGGKDLIDKAPLVLSVCVRIMAVFEHHEGYEALGFRIKRR